MQTHEYVVLDDQIRVAVVHERSADGSPKVATLYRNLDDLAAGVILQSRAEFA